MKLVLRYVIGTLNYVDLDQFERMYYLLNCVHQKFQLIKTHRICLPVIFVSIKFVTYFQVF